MTYTYDADGLRVEKSSGTLYWRSYAGQVLEETDTSGNMERDYVFFDKRRIAWRDSTGVHYYFSDAVGSTRVVTDASGNTCFQADYYPYGQENDYNTTCSPTYKFTGYEFDSETGNYYAYAREYDPRIGRFLSADPLGGAIGDPQSLNRYSYVLNNPESLIDPSGMGPQQWGGACGSTDGDPNPCPPPPPPGTTWYLTGDDLCGIFPGPWCGGPGGPGGGVPGAGSVSETPTAPQTQKQKDCAQGLREAGADQGAVNRAAMNWSVLEDAGEAYGVDPAMLAAIGIRESGFLDRNQVGGGPGVGIFQITPAPGPSVFWANDPSQAALYAAGLLSSNIAYMESKYPGYTGSYLFQAAAADYNMGPINKQTGMSNFSGNPATIDVGTTGNDYGADILLLMNCF